MSAPYFPNKKNQESDDIFDGLCRCGLEDLKRSVAQRSAQAIRARNKISRILIKLRSRENMTLWKKTFAEGTQLGVSILTEKAFDVCLSNKTIKFGIVISDEGVKKQAIIGVVNC